MEIGELFNFLLNFSLIAITSRILKKAELSAIFFVLFSINFSVFNLQSQGRIQGSLGDKTPTLIEFFFNLLEFLIKNPKTPLKFFRPYKKKFKLPPSKNFWTHFWDNQGYTRVYTCKYTWETLLKFKLLIRKIHKKMN